MKQFSFLLGYLVIKYVIFYFLHEVQGDFSVQGFFQNSTLHCRHGYADFIAVIIETWDQVL